MPRTSKLAVSQGAVAKAAVKQAAPGKKAPASTRAAAHGKENAGILPAQRQDTDESEHDSADMMDNEDADPEEGGQLMFLGRHADNDDDNTHDAERDHAGPSGSGVSQSLLELLGGQVDDELLRPTFRKLMERDPLFNKKQECRTKLLMQQDQWHLRLRRGFNLLFYGWGSKFGLLEEFARKALASHGAVVAFRGFNAKLTAKEVVAVTAGALLDRSCKGIDPHKLLSDLQQEARDWPDRHVYVLIHNLEGEGLHEELDLLSRLAACPTVHILASIDRISFPMAMDVQVSARFRWYYVDATTYEPYVLETSGTPSILAGCTHAAKKISAGAVLGSMVSNAREVFRVLAEYLMDDPECEGVAFAHLYRMCRERFLVTSEAALRSHLTEFLDHELMAVRSSEADGERLTIPLEHAALKAMLEELGKMAAA